MVPEYPRSQVQNSVIVTAEIPNLSVFADRRGEGGERGDGSMRAVGNHTQLYLHEHRACAPVAHTNGARMRLPATPTSGDASTRPPLLRPGSEQLSAQ